MPQPLSAEWLDALGARLSGIVIGESGSLRLALGQVVTGAPGGTLAYTVHLGGGEPAALVVGSVDEATVVLLEDFEAATALIGGAPVAGLLEEGRIKLRGTIAALLGAESQLAALGAALSAS